MAYAVFDVPNEKKNAMQKVINDNMVSRLSITVRDAKTLGVEKDAQLVLVDGNEEGVNRAIELFKESKIPKYEKAEEIYKKIKAEEENAASGMGMIFG